MKNKTQQTEQNPCPQGSTATAIILICAAAAASTLLFWGVPKLAKKYQNRNVTCHECDHIVARSSAGTRKKFKFFYGQDDKYDLLWFCKQHYPAWDYTVEPGHVEGEIYFKSKNDHQVDKDGCEITNTYSGIYFFHDSNGTARAGVRLTTNIGGTYRAKHLVP